MLQGHEPGARYKLKEEHVTTIGRSSQSDISLVSPTVSRNHCEVAYIDGLWHMCDLESRKGTIINGERVEGRRVLKPGDIIRLSTNVFRFDIIDENQQNEGLLALREAAMNGEIRQRNLSDEGSLAAIRERGKIELDEKRRDKKAKAKAKTAPSVPLLPNVVFVLIGSLLVLVVAGGAYHWKSQQVLAQRRNLKTREANASDALKDLETVLVQPKFDVADAVARAQKLVTEYPRTTPARTVVEKILPKLKVQEADAQWHGLRELPGQVLELEQKQRFQEAIDLISKQRKSAIDQGLRELLDRLNGEVMKAAEAAYAQLEEAANEALEENDKDFAIIQYRIVIDKFGVPALKARAEQRIREIHSR